MSPQSPIPPTVSIRRPTAPEDYQISDELAKPQADLLSPGNFPLSEKESLVQPGLRLSDIAEELGGELTIVEGGPKFEGGYADVSKGIWTSPEGARLTVAIKKLRGIKASPELLDETQAAAVEKRNEIRMKRETLVWTREHHPNILTFLGYRSHPDPQLISPWCEHGNLTKYLQDNPNTPSIDKLELILQAGYGLAYLHRQTPPICHGDIKPENVLVKDTRVAVLTDFGLSRVLQILDTRTGLTTSGGARGTQCYMAPELLMEDSFKASRESDIYAFAGLILRVLSGKAPYEKVAPGLFIVRIMEGSPPRPEEHPNLPPDDPLWNFMRRCWDGDPVKRPRMSDVISTLESEIERRRQSA